MLFGKRLRKIRHRTMQISTSDSNISDMQNLIVSKWELFYCSWESCRIVSNSSGYTFGINSKIRTHKIRTSPWNRGNLLKDYIKTKESFTNAHQNQQILKERFINALKRSLRTNNAFWSMLWSQTEKYNIYLGFAWSIDHLGSLKVSSQVFHSITFVCKWCFHLPNGKRSRTVL